MSKKREIRQTKNAGPKLPESIPCTADKGDILALVGGYHGAPHNVLGPHLVTLDGDDVLAVRVFRPLDERVFVVGRDDGS